MINKQNFNLTIQNILKDRREKAKQVAEDNLNLALKNEKLKQSFYKVRGLQVDLSKFDNGSAEAKQILAEIEKERVILREELANCGLTKEDLKPQYSCKLCNDTGFVDKKKCSCFKAEQNTLYLNECGINKNSLPSFDKVDYQVFGSYKDDVKKIYTLTQSFVTKENGTKTNLVLYGQTGVGKTYLTECALNEALDSDLYTVYTTAFKLNEVFINYHIAKLDEKQYILSPYLTSDLLIIDDLGSENILMNVTIEYLYLLLDTRSRNGLKTIITTNLTPGKIQDTYEDRVFSRIFNKQIGLQITMPGEDLRFKK
ncbi:MAG: ATP-binding protein [Clostridia bacterium]|nr:ATP-binding protein [Clostridia bacterium]